MKFRDSANGGGIAELIAAINLDFGLSSSIFSEALLDKLLAADCPLAWGRAMQTASLNILHSICPCEDNCGL